MCDTYGKQIARTGTSNVIFGYNGKDGVVTDENGLIYMRARYYSPELRRFVNADIVAGEISNAITLNRFAYANGNPVSHVDPFGLSAERGHQSPLITAAWENFWNEYNAGKTILEACINDDLRKALYKDMRHSIQHTTRPNNIGKGTWNKQIQADLKWLDDVLGDSSNLAKGLQAVPWISIALDASLGIYNNIQNGVPFEETAAEATVDVMFGIGGTLLSTVAAGAVTGAISGSVAPGVGNLIGAAVGVGVGIVFYILTEVVEYNGKTYTDRTKEKFIKDTFDSSGKFGG